MTTRLLASSSIPPLARSGRWLTAPSGSLLASWASASLSFLFTGSKLILSVGENTERKDKLNGGTPMIAIFAGSTEDAALNDLGNWRTFDPEAQTEIVIFDGAAVRQEKTFVRLTVIDWASKFELESLIVDDTASIEPWTPAEDKRIAQILVVGDSISSGLAVPVEQGGEPVPFGILNTFPFVAQRILGEDKASSLGVGMELVGYPGFSLVHPTEEEQEAGQRNGMVEAFFWESPWNKDTLIDTPASLPTALLVELGTNDQFFNVSSERFGNVLLDFVASLKKWSRNSIRHVWLVPPFPDADTENRELNMAMPSFIPLLESKFGDEISFKLCDLVEGLTTANTVDGVHPPLAVHNDLGKKLADFIARSLVEN